MQDEDVKSAAHDNTGGSTAIAQQILSQLAGGPLPDWLTVAPRLRRVALRPKEVLFHSGESRPYVYFVGQGLMKLLYEMPDGKAWIKAFTCQHGFFASLESVRPGGRTAFSAVAVTGTLLEYIEYAALDEMANSHPMWQRAMARAFEIYGARKERRERDLLTLSPEERYLQFTGETPEIAGLVSHRDAAAYIRVTPVALSRIKSRLRHKAEPA